MISAMDRLIESDGSVSIPGLEFDSVVDNLVEKKYSTQLSECTTQSERSELKGRLTEYYMNGEGKTAVKMEIASIKSNFVAAKEQLTSVSTAISGTIASNAIPSVIGTASPNPASILAENVVKKNQLSAMLNSISACLVNLMRSAVSLYFPLPNSVISLTNTLAETKSALNSIPLP